MYLLSLKNINKYYNLKRNEKTHVLKDINLSFNTNELVAIIGESGSGKSTLMNIIGGLDSQYNGQLLVNGRNIKELKARELDDYRKSQIGFIFQSFNLIPHLSVLNNVIIAMTLSNVKKKERVKRAKEVLINLGLKDHINKKPSQLSGGQKQRVAIARALINNPKIIIADEPTGSLDSNTSEQVLKIIKDIAKRGKLVIMVTHSEKVAACCSRVIKIADGRMIGDEEFYKLEAYHEETYDTSVSIKKKGNSLNVFNAVKLALNNMKEKLIRNAAISIGTSIGIMSLILMLSFGNGIKTYFNKTMNSYVNPLVIEVNMPSDDSETVNLDIVSIEKPNINKQNPFKDDDIQKLSQIENVASVEKGYTEISMGANSLSYDGKGSNVMRISTISSNITESDVQEGTLPKKGEILINKSISDKVGEDIIGKKVNLRILVNQKIINKEFVVSGVYASAGGDLNSIMKSIFFNYSDLEDLYSDNKFQLRPNVLYLNTASSKFTNGIKEKVKELGYSGSSQEQMIDMFNSMISILTYVLSGISGIALLVSTIMIIIIMYISVVERTKEIGILKAIGARKKDIRRIFICEAFLIGFFSGIIGIILSYSLAKGINSMSNKLFDINMVLIKNSYRIFGISLSIVIGTLAGLLPANKAAKLDPVESLRRD
ncbi:ABC transporter ATP-binding protein/permease [Clostridium sp.]|uniref:ABC transporter ATP-binding protein/permease n=1 Tax=Clostridium sp. TaxID=1506 RepID=UPI0026389874|nr:ABC transporter ATP-binding protein/permease [Clostridium sp.]